MTSSTEAEKFIYHPWWFMLRGATMFVLGALLFVFSILVPKVVMFGVVSSWLPLSAILIMVFGAIRCIDALSSDKASHVIMFMQSAIIDLVCGFVILTNVGEKAIIMTMLIASYLLIQGLSRIMMTFTLQVPNPDSARIGGLVSVLLGLMAWLNWPFSDLWFLSVALSAEIANRGWVLMIYAYSVSKQPVVNE